MSVKKEQKIIVLINNIESDKILILHGIKLATAFNKELCLFYNSSKKETTVNKNIGTTLNEYKNVVKNIIPSLRISSLTIQGKFEHLIDNLADNHEAVLVVSGNSTYSKLSKTIQRSPIPFLLIDTNSTTISDYKKIIFPVDLRRETKDAALWASYFARFNKSGINVLVANEINKDNRKGVTKNITSIKQLFVKLKIGIKFFKGKENSFKIQFEALNVALSSNSDLIIILGSSFISIFDLIIGLPEKKIIKKAGILPVLIINPRKDMYILCD
jgi:hypothetical protein